VSISLIYTLTYSRTKENLSLTDDLHSPLHRRTYNPLPVQCRPCPIWPPARPLSLTYTYWLPCYRFQWTWPVQAPKIPRTKSQIPFPELRLCQVTCPYPRLCVVFRKKYWFLWGRVFSPRPTSKPNDHPPSAVRDSLFNIFAATLHTWRPFPLSVTRGRAMPCWQWAHLTLGSFLVETRIKYTSPLCYIVVSVVEMLRFVDSSLWLFCTCIKYIQGFSSSQQYSLWRIAWFKFCKKFYSGNMDKQITSGQFIKDIRKVKSADKQKGQTIMVSSNLGHFGTLIKLWVQSYSSL
jgi:hypothetical protein